MIRAESKLPAESGKPDGTTVKTMILIFRMSLLLNMIMPAFAERDREYWSKCSFDVPISRKISYVLKPEWRFKNEMSNNYLFKIEQGVAFQFNKYLELAPYYIRQKIESAGKSDTSDMMYIDMTGKIPFKKIFDFRIINRLRYQYNFDKKFTVWRNSTKLAKGFQIGKFETSPFIENEMFYNTSLNKVNQNQASIGISLALNKHVNVAASYVLDAKNKGNDWIYADVLLTSVGIKF
ncbi:MAG: DUF2490 domain-containing protein [Elusimicrobia bacterium]|nr:DUF2490 domain-containing protein [Elusimicrobiota bacterium]